MSDVRPLKVDGVDYSPEGIEELRRELSALRGAAMAQGAAGPVVVLSHAIALLAHLAELEGMTY